MQSPDRLEPVETAPSAPPPGAVFVSYASEDALAAVRISEALRAAGIDVWLDQDALRGGDSWDAKIKKQIQDCALFLPVISAHTEGRPEGYFRGEWNLATRRMMNMAHDAAFLVPVVIDGTREAHARVPEEFLRAHWTRLPGGETPPEFARQVRDLLARRRRADAPAESYPLPDAHTRTAMLRSLARHPQRTAAMGAAVLVAALLAYVWTQRAGKENEAEPAQPGPLPAATELPARSVAVLVFEDRGGSGGSDVLAEGIPETVMYQLSLMKGLVVISRKSSFAFRDSDEDIRLIGRKLNVRYLLEGSVQTAGTRLRVTSSLIDAQTGASVWSGQFNPEQQDVFAVQDQIAQEVARALQVTLQASNDPSNPLKQGGTDNYDAYFEFLRGRALLANMRVGDLPAAVEALQAAIRLDTKFASAYVLLAQAKIVLAEQEGDLSDFPEERRAAMALIDRALELNPQSGEAYVERGYMKLSIDAAAADADFRRALELAPNYPRAYESLAAELFQSVARRREALEMLDKARRLDPLDIRLDVLKAMYLLWGPGDVQQASAIMEAVLQRDPLYVPALMRLAEIRWTGQDRYAEAAALAEQALALDPGNETARRYLSVIYLSLGEPAAARDVLEDTSEFSGLQVVLQVNFGQWREAGESAYSLITYGTSYRQIEHEIALAIRKHARLTGDYARAIEALERWALVSWEDGEPILEGQLDMGVNVAALGDMLIASGEDERGRALLVELLADAEVQINRYGRGEAWLNDGRAMAYALLGRPDEAMATLQRQAKLGFLFHNRGVGLEIEPAYDSLRERKDFQALLKAARQVKEQEHEKFLEMRKEGQVPNRR
jgi:TolB-like protein/Flp pilus assembly protein TadD